MFVLQPHLQRRRAGQSRRVPDPVTVGGGACSRLPSTQTVGRASAGLLTSDKIKYLVQLLAPVALSALLSVESLVVLPTLLFNLLSTFSYQHEHPLSLHQPDHPGLSPGRLCSSRGAQGRAGRNGPWSSSWCWPARFSAYLWGPADWSRQPAGEYDPQHAEVRALVEAVALIPDDAVVSCPLADQHTPGSPREDLRLPDAFLRDLLRRRSMDHRRLPVADEVQYVLEIPGPSHR